MSWNSKLILLGIVGYFGYTAEATVSLWSAIRFVPLVLCILFYEQVYDFLDSVLDFEGSRKDGKR